MLSKTNFSKTINMNSKKLLNILLFLSIIFHFFCTKHNEQNIQTYCENNSSLNPKAKIIKDEIIGADDSTLKINQIQFIASHNSYRIKINPSIIKSLQLLTKDFNKQFETLDYTHIHLERQFNEYDIRGIEIDTFYDSKGNTYFEHKLLDSALAIFPESETHIYSESLKYPGFKVLHVKDLDFESYYPTLKDALSSIKIWSEKNPNHLPLFINIETKGVEDSLAYYGRNSPLASQYTLPENNNSASADEIDLEIKSVFGENLDKIITPQKLLTMTSSSSISEFVEKNKWPSIKQLRGKIFLIMEGTMRNFYLEKEMQRAMFVYYESKSANSLFFLKNDPIKQIEEIKTLVSEYYFVRTRSDSDTVEARNGDYTTYLNAINSGAQIISTDYYKQDDRAGTPGWTDYKVCLGINMNAQINATTFK